MKKITVSILAFLTATCGAFAQSADYPQNQITVSTSDNMPLLLGSMIGGGVIGSLTSEPAGTKLGDVSTRGCFTVGYMHNFDSRFGVGGDVSYAGAKIEFDDKHTGKVAETESANIFMAMATGKCNYFKSHKFSLGGVAGVGVMTDFKGSTSVAYQVDPLDFRVGSDKAGGFLRIGFGVRGIFTLGFDVTI